MRAAEKIRATGLPTNAVEDRLLRAVLEEGGFVDDETMRERWAQLLANAATGRVQRDCIDVASTFRALSAEEIDAYLAREQPYDCAGAVKSEALGIALFERIESDDPTALIGLPLIALARMLRSESVDVLRGPA